MSTAVLFVTRDAGIVPPGLAKNSRVTDSVEDALNLCASASFGAVFCDAASLADGGSGFRLGRQMRRNGISIPLFLMTNSILSSMEGVAAASGPVASMMIDDVLDELYPKYPNGIHVDVFVDAVALHVGNGKARADFLRELLV